MRFKISDIFVALTGVAIFMAFTKDEPVRVIQSLAIYCGAGFGALVLTVCTIVRLGGGLARARNLFPRLVPKQLWKRMILDTTAMILWLVSIASANGAIVEGSQVNPVIYLFPTFACFMIYRYVRSQKRINQTKRES